VTDRRAAAAVAQVSSIPLVRQLCALR
jgi:hypothetical protein